MKRFARPALRPLAALAVFAATLAAAGVTPDVPTVVTVVQTGATSMLTATATGLTLYVFDRDRPGESTCTLRPQGKKDRKNCAQEWPPLDAVTGDTPIGAFAVITRDDGGLQWTYKGRPLYTSTRDQVPLDTRGDGIGGEWHIARP